MKVNFLTISFLILLCTCNGVSAWYNTAWDNRIPIEINNSENPALEDYQFNVSFVYGINESSIRVINESDSSIVHHWCENETEGLCYELWFNVSVGSEINNDYYIYYGNDAVASTSDYDVTFTKTYNNTGLVLELHMDESTGHSIAVDSSGEGNNGTLTNMNTTGNATSGWQGVDGGQWDNRSDAVFAAGDQLRFDGVNDYVTCGNEPSLDITDAITISAWVNGGVIGTSQNGYAGIVASSKYKLDVNEGYGKFFFRVYTDSGTAPYAVGTTTPQANTWYYVVAEYTGSKIRIYVNGILEDEEDRSGAILPHSGVEIGRESGSPTRFFNGSIDDVRIYNRSLSEDEIYRQYIRSKYAVDVPIVILGESEQPKHVNISLHSKYPDTLFTNYTGLLTSSYIVESNYPLNLSTLAFLMGINYTLTDDYHSYLKVPANSIADDGIYRAHNRNITPLMNWEYNDTITEGNVLKWAGGDINDHWINNKTINSTHTWINITGIASNVFSSSFYLGRKALYESEKTGIEINKGQGIIIKVYDLEVYRNRNNDYWVNLFFDTQLEATPDSNIDIWYCNGSFNPNVDDPANCEFCDRMDTWASSRWTDHDWRPHNNVSFAKPLCAYAGIPADIPPDFINYVYFTSKTVSSKSYILNATNDDPGICNLTFAETNTMWLRNEVAGTNTPHAYTPSFYITFVRDFLEFTHHLYVANDQGVWGHSDYNIVEIGLSNMEPTYTKYNYYWWNGTTDYLMNNSYTKSFWINATFGVDPDNGASLTHVLSLYDDDYNFVAFINNSLIGNHTDIDIWFNITGYSNGYYQFKIVSTDNEGSTSVSWSEVFKISLPTKYNIMVTRLINIFAAIILTIKTIVYLIIDVFPFIIAMALLSSFIYLIGMVFGRRK